MVPKTGNFVVCKNVSGLVNKGVIIPAENQAAEITFKKSASTLNWPTLKLRILGLYFI